MPTAAASAAWFEQRVISTTDPPIVTAPSGAAVAAWTMRDSGVALVASVRSRGGAWSAPRAIARASPGAAAVPVPLAAGFNGRETPRVLWGWAPDPSTANTGERSAEPVDVDPGRLQLSTLLPDAATTKPVLAEVAGSSRLLAPPELAVLADGTSVVSAIVDATSTAHAGGLSDALVAAVDRPGQSPTAVVLERGVAGYSELSMVEDDDGGATTAVSGWRLPVTSYATTVTTFRWTAEAGWRRSSAAAPELFGLVRLAAHAGEGDATHLVGGSATGPVYARLGRADEWLAAPQRLPVPPQTLTLSGTLGGGTRASVVGVRRNIDGRAVLAVGLAPAGERGHDPSPLFGLTALWAYSEVAPGRWLIDPIDPDADLAGVGDATLAQGPAMQLRATWTMSGWRDGSCGEGIFRTERAAAGSWGPRRMLAYWPGCQQTVGVSEATDGSDAFSWSLREGVLRAEPLPVASGAVKTFAPRARTHTARAIRRRGGLVVDCGPTGFGLCSASVLRAAAGARGADRAALRCLDAAATSAVDPSRRGVLVRLESACLPRRHAFPSAVIRVAFDAPGQTIQTRTVLVRGGR